VSVTLLRSDAGRLPLADASVDLIVTSPPYWALRSYTDGGEHYAGQIGSEPTPAAYIEALIDCTREWMRVLKTGGSIWVNLGDKYATRYSSVRGGGRAGLNDDDDTRNRSGQNRTGVPEKSLLGLPWRYALRCTDDLRLILRAEVIWEKATPLPESVTDRVRRVHETWFHLTVSPRYFANGDAVREPHAPDSLRSSKAGSRPMTARNTSIVRTGVGAYVGANPLGKMPGSVRKVAAQPLKVPPELTIDHFAAFPMEWPGWIISGWSPEDGTVLDPFGGTGTTALMAHALGRRGISVDMSADYCRLARWRTSDPSQLAAAMQVEKPPIERAGQLDLFDPQKGAA
jgi:site-specific DNA-methyltransferase (cytosine-N4-specific)